MARHALALRARLTALVIMACGDVFDYVQIQKLTPMLESAPLASGGAIGRAIDEAIRAQQTYRGFVWYNWFAQGLTFTFFAALVGSGSPLARPGQGLLFTLALPAGRTAWLGARAAIGLAELLAFVVVPSLVYPLLAATVGPQYGLGEALVHSACAFTAASVLFAAAVLLSSMFTDVWRPLLATCLAGLILSFAEAAAPDLPGLFAVMSAESYFNGGSLPWLGLLVCVVLTAATLYAAAANVTRRDF